MFFNVLINKLLKSIKIVRICLMIKIEFLARKFLCQNFILPPLFLSAQHISEKSEGNGSVLLINGSGCDPGGPKHTDPTDLDPVSEHCHQP